MSKIQEINFLDLKNRYPSTSSTADVAGLINSLASGAPIPPFAEELLYFYELMEIASLIRMVPEELPSEFKEQAIRDLEESGLLAYCTSAGIQAQLASQLLQRVKGPQRVYERDVDNTPASFLYLLNIHDMIAEDEEITAFKSIIRNDPCLNKTVSSLEHLAKDTLLMALVSGPDNIFDVFAGLTKFIDFCETCAQFLTSCESQPLFQLAVWRNLSRWFQQPGYDEIQCVLQKIKEMERPLADSAELMLDMETIAELEQHAMAIEQLQKWAPQPTGTDGCA